MVLSNIVVFDSGGSCGGCGVIGVCGGGGAVGGGGGGVGGGGGPGSCGRHGSTDFLEVFYLCIFLEGQYLAFCLCIIYKSGWCKC